MFRKMPKPVHHHTHLTGAIDVDFLVKLTYYRYVYYSEKANKFKVTQRKEGILEEGYMKVNSLR